MALNGALLGLGSMGKNHFRVLSALPGVNLLAVVEPRGNYVGDYRGVQIVRDIAELEGLAIDFSVVATPTDTHEMVCRRLAKLGSHVLVEKPIASSVEQGERMAQDFARLDKIGAVGHIERYNPAVIQLKARLEAGEIGEIYQISTRRQGSFPERISDVGVTKDLATHDIHLTSWIAGANYQHVFAETAHKVGRQIEDMIVITGRLQNGILVNHVVNWLSPTKERQIAVTGERGTLIANTLTADLTLHKNGREQIDWELFANFRGVSEGDQIKYSFSKKEPLISEIESFCSAIISGSTDYVSFAEGIQVLRVVEAALHSSREGERVTV